MKKLLLIMLIAIVVISCKKEEKSNVIPVNNTPVDSEYVVLSRDIFLIDIRTLASYVVHDDGEMNTNFNYLTEQKVFVTSNASDSTFNVQLPRKFYLTENTLAKDTDSTFRVNPSKFKRIGNDVVFEMYPYTIYKPIRVGSIVDTNYAIKVIYKTNELQDYRNVTVTISI